MQSRILLTLCTTFFLVACDQGVQVGNQSDLMPTSDTSIDPFASKEPLIIDDSEARVFVDATTTTAVTNPEPQCSYDLDVITPSEMSYTNGFALVTDEYSTDAIRARNTVSQDEAHYIEVCVQSNSDRDYFIRTEISGPSIREDSFYFTVGDSKPVIYDVGRSNGGYFETDIVRSRDSDPLRVSLKAGRNIIRFHYRERNTALAEIKFLRLPPVISTAENETDSTEFSSNVLACAQVTNLPPAQVAFLIAQHLPTNEPAFTNSGIDTSDGLVNRYLITDDRKESPRVFCLQDSRPVFTGSERGLQETVNQVFPSDAPSLILGSSGADKLLNRPMEDNIVFYGFAGDDYVEWQFGGKFFGGDDNDSVQWQIGGEFIGGDDNDTVIGLTDGVFNGESGQNTVEAATSDAKISNANVVRANVPTPQAPTSLEIVGIDDYIAHVRWPENDAVLIETIYNASDRLFFDTYQTGKRSINPTSRLGYELQVKGRAVVELDDGISLLSRETKTVSFSKPELTELIERFNGVRIRGPERFDRLTDATTMPGQLRWLSATPSTYFRNPTGDEPLIEMRLADESITASISRNTLGQMLNATPYTLCDVIVGESTHSVIAVTANTVEAFGFGADNLQLRWRHVLSTATTSSDVCDNSFYSNGSLYFENKSEKFRTWTDTVRVTDNGEITRIPAPQIALDGFNQLPTRMQHASSPNGDIAISLYRAQNTGPEFPFGNRTILVVHHFDGSGNASQTFTLAAQEPLANTEYLSRAFQVRAVTDGNSAWIVASYAFFEHAVLRISLSTGIVEDTKRYEPGDELYSYPDTSPNLVTINADVIEIGRNARVIRIDANTLERLEDVKVAGKVVAFDENTVITTVSDEQGLSAYSFPR